ncbi:hypothetical protein FACS1894127_6740 [Clostridia bacterium]|nr:hypothetical protein FACS1894127_6740 [Clostridia bacterium]
MKKTKLFRLIIAVTTAIILVVSGSISAMACTGFYMGSETTDNGSTFWGRSEDIRASYSKLLMVHPAETHEAGSYYSSSTGFKWPYPEKTLRYLMVKDSVFNESITPEPYAEAGVNEKNVAISATVTLSGAKSGILGTNDPQVSSRNGGLAETDLASVVLMQAVSARDAMELVAKIIDTVGAAGREGFTVSDPKEVWYMEILSGHQYVAVKAPKDKIAVSPNVTMLDAIDITDTENVIASPNLIQVAEKAGTLVKDDNGRIRIASSYANITSVANRLYLGYYYLKGVDAAKALTTWPNPYFIDPRPAKNYSLYEAMRLLAYHGNAADSTDGKYNANPTGNGSAIGNGGTVESHVFENRSNMPDALSTVEWITMGPAEFSLYLPYYGSLITDTYESYWNADTKTFNEDSFYWVCRQIFTLSNEHRSAVDSSVSSFLEKYQKSLIDQQKSVDEAMLRIYNYDPALAQQKATELSKAVAGEAFANLKILLKALQDYAASATIARAAFALPESLTTAAPHYDIDVVGGADVPGDFQVTVDKEKKAVSVKGSGYVPNESLSVRVAYNSIPTAGANDAEAVVTADEKGNFETSLQSDAITKAPWLGGEKYYAAVAGSSASAPVFASAAKINAPLRLNVRLKAPYQLNISIDSTTWEYRSSNPAVAKVDKNGLITPVRVGTSVITVSATDGSGVSASIMLNVAT